MNKDKILFFANYEIKEFNSAPSIRAYYILKELEKKCEVFLVSGLRLKRLIRMLIFFLLYKRKNYTGMYFEAKAHPMSLIDKLFILYIKKKIPVSVYIRDAYFYEKCDYKTFFYEKNNSVLNDKYLLRTKDTCYWLIKNTHVQYFQSQSFGELFKSKNINILSPASECRKNNFNEKLKEKYIVYAGPCSKAYGTLKMLEIFKLINERIFIKLKIITPENQKKIIENYLNEKWLEVYHKNHFELDELLRKAYLSILLMPVNEYNNLKLNVKIFEYFSYGLPLISTDCYEIAKIIKENNVGIIIEENNINKTAERIIELYNDIEKVKYMSNNALDFIKKENTWEHRVQKILMDFKYYGK